MSEAEEDFLRRWSRLKREAKEQPPAATSARQPVQKADTPPPELPPVEKLTLESDFRGFFHPQVDENLRRAALKKLFSDPHFNVMDRLDVYIDDYSKSDPLPAAMLAQLKQAQKILDWAREKPADAERTEAGSAEQPPAAANAQQIASAESDASVAPVVTPDAPGDQPAEVIQPRPAG
ncbi:MAG: DUF3306 domain-containing protein [Betaproteobacteria bacterium]|nr:DUF3306 domain-containing protein [Betaproteobacteria bacterium]